TTSVTDVLDKSREPEMDSEMDVSPVEITEWCNGLLGMMLVLTSCTGVRIRKPFLDQFERLVTSSIESNISKIVTVGYQCLKGVILIESASSGMSASSELTDKAKMTAGKARARLFMRELVPFVVTTIVVRAAQESATTTTTTATTSQTSGGSSSPSGSKDDKNGVGMQVIEEGIQTLKSLAVASSETARPGMISIIMSTLVPLLQDVNVEMVGSTGSRAQGVHTLGLNHLLGLGTQYPTEFRYGVSRLSVERRTRLENAIRQSVLEQQQQQQKQREREQREQERLARERDRVKIELKSSFSGFT
ncbi:hypothetical protein BX616_008277, partial [Lobosporangium transversale]